MTDTKKEEVVEETVVEETKEEEVLEEGSEQVTPPAEKGAEELDPKLVDEEGVPWQNRAKEFERKYLKSLEMRAKEKEVKEAQEEVEFTPEEQAVDEVVRKRQDFEDKASVVIDDVISDLNSQFPGHFDNDNGELKAIIIETSKKLDIKSKLNPQTIQNIAFMASKIRDVKAKAKAGVKKLVTPQKAVGSEVLTPSAKGGAGKDVQLTAEEEEYADHNRFGGVFSNEEIKDMFKATQKKKSKET